MLHLPLRSSVSKPPASPQPQLNVKSINVTPSTTQKPEDQPPQVDDPTIKFIKVPVTPQDSVISIAVRNGVSESQLRQFNRKLIYDYCDFVDHVWVPVGIDANPNVSAKRSEEDKKTNESYFALKTFMSLVNGKCEEQEAGYYLEEAHNDPRAAYELWKADSEWEANSSSVMTPAQRSRAVPQNTPASYAQSLNSVLASDGVLHFTDATIPSAKPAQMFSPAPAPRSSSREEVREQPPQTTSSNLRYEPVDEIEFPDAPTAPLMGRNSLLSEGLRQRKLIERHDDVVNL